MSLEDVQKNWEGFARTDPLWSILSDEEKRNNRWDVDAFFATGREEIASVVAEMEKLGLHPARRRALDFGCGVGRLTQALAASFDEVIGVDISPTMVEKAREYDKTGKCRFIVNTSPAIPAVSPGTIDLVYSRIVLQHNEVPAIEQYLGTLARLVSRRGVLAFQLPSERSSVIKRVLHRILPRWLIELRQRVWWRGGPRMLMNGIPRDRVVQLVQAAGLTLVEAIPDGSAGAGWNSFRYYFRAAP